MADEEEDVQEPNISLVQLDPDSEQPIASPQYLPASVGAVLLGILFLGICNASVLPGLAQVILAMTGVAFMTPILYIFFRLYQRLVPQAFGNRDEFIPEPTGILET